ncbi:hypothetical protein SDC9_86356 [bioreactor metagenome]|uniref:Uncharacterized protein n=1 Tax=bioreactor metagenome TaxID=1076179 RepID=A0A644ZFR4_9ZZZZ
MSEKVFRTMVTNKTGGQKTSRIAFYICLAVLITVIYAGSTFLNPNALDYIDPRRQQLMYITTFFIKPVTAICTLLLPALAANSGFSTSRWVKALLWTVAISINVLGIIFAVKLYWENAGLPQRFVDYGWYLFILNPGYLFVAELPLALAVAIGGRLDRGRPKDIISNPDEPPIPSLADLSQTEESPPLE